MTRDIEQAAFAEQETPAWGVDEPMDRQLLQANVHALQADQYEREDEDRELGG